MKRKPTFLDRAEPLLTCMVQTATADEAVACIRNAVYDGADAFGFQMCRLAPAHRTEDELRRIFACVGNRPLYVTNYRDGFNEGMSDEELTQGLLFEQRCGANLLDVMGDLYARDERQLTFDPRAVEKQKALIEKIHERGGEVLMSSHVCRFMPANEVLDMAREQHARGADIAKVVSAANTQEEELENLRITALLRRELDFPFLFLSVGSHTKLHRTIGPMLGSCMWLTVQRHDALSTKAQPVLSAIRTIADRFDYQGDRS